LPPLLVVGKGQVAPLLVVGEGQVAPLLAVGIGVKGGQVAPFI